MWEHGGEMSYYYSTDKNVQLLLALMKEHGIRRAIVSPGTTDMKLIVSMQHDDWFELYSCVDERSAAYMACGLASETGEPVVIACTESTASREYIAGLTEAYHRKLPILAITGCHAYNVIGHLEPQVIDRSVSLNDVVKFKVDLPVIKDEEDIWESNVKINKAILGLTHRGGGPVHINLPWGGPTFDFSVKELPKVRSIHRYDYTSDFPSLPNGRIAISIGTHKDFDDQLTNSIDSFCEKHNAVVFCDHTSKYYGKYRFIPTLVVMQQVGSDIFSNIDLLIHIGEESGDDSTKKVLSQNAKEVWRVSLDGEVRDPFRKLTKIFEMDEKYFFDKYSFDKKEKYHEYLDVCKDAYNEIFENIPELPFSSAYVANKISSKLPSGSMMHLGPSDSIRLWNLYNLPEGVRTGMNSGCRGIDGAVSSAIGASFSKKSKFYYCIVGDLTFFYDLNSLGNKHIGNNLRIILINNNGADLFRHNAHPLMTWVKEPDLGKYVAAEDHFGAASRSLVKNIAENLGFQYLYADDKESFSESCKDFLDPNEHDKPMLFEIFTNYKIDADACDLMYHIKLDAKSQVKSVMKNMLGDKGTGYLRKIMKK